MSVETDAIERTRAFSTDMFASVLNEIEGKSEIEVRDEILNRMSGNAQVFPSGWYDPPQGGVSVLFGRKPFERLRFDTLRNPIFWPSKDAKFDKEAVGILYASPVDRATYMLGDTGFTVYGGTDRRVQDHIRASFEAIRGVAEHARVGMAFTELYSFGSELFRQRNLEVTPWMTANHDSSKNGLGHTVPGSYDGGLSVTNFEEAKKLLTTTRKYINAIEKFVIPDTVAFTVEARLVNRERQDLPCLFHFVVVFSNGRKQAFADFDDIFRTVGMTYML